MALVSVALSSILCDASPVALTFFVSWSVPAEDHTMAIEELDTRESSMVTRYLSAWISWFLNIILIISICQRAHSSRDY